MKQLLPAGLIVFTGIIIAYFLIKPKQLPVYNPSDINPKLVDKSLQSVSKLHRIGNFSLINQNGKIITENDFNGKIYIADFFFVTCPTICPKMTKQMKRVYNKFETNNDVFILSHTVMPEHDSVPILKEYEIKNEVSAPKWNFVTGDKKQIYDLARKAYFAAITDGDGGKKDFIHTENFVLIDKEKRIRGFYDGTSEHDVDRLINDVATLLNEYN